MERYIHLAEEALTACSGAVTADVARCEQQPRWASIVVQAKRGGLVIGLAGVKLVMFAVTPRSDACHCRDCTHHRQKVEDTCRVKHCYLQKSYTCLIESSWRLLLTFAVSAKGVVLLIVE